MSDVRFKNEGSIATLLPTTEKAWNWMQKNLDFEPWQWRPYGLVCEHRMARDILEGIREAGFEVEVV